MEPEELIHADRELTEKELTAYAKKFMERPYETIWGVKDDRNNKTVTIYSTFDTTHPDCPIKILDFPYRSGSR